MIIRVRLRATPSSWVHRPRCKPRWPYARRYGASRMPRGPSAVFLMCSMSNMFRGTYSTLCGHSCYVASQLVGQPYRGGIRVFGHITLTEIGAIGGATDHLATWLFQSMPQKSPWTRRTLGALPPSSAV